MLDRQAIVLHKSEPLLFATLNVLVVTLPPFIVLLLCDVCSFFLKAVAVSGSISVGARDGCWVGRGRE